jgi:uncharacterized membrane protein YfhO
LNMQHFEQGFGLGGNFYMEIYYACFALIPLFSVVCVAAGLLLRTWEKLAASSRSLFFLLCLGAPSIVFLPRGTISAVTSAMIYGVLFLCLIYLVTDLLKFAALEPGTPQNVVQRR